MQQPGQTALAAQLVSDAFALSRTQAKAAERSDVAISIGERLLHVSGRLLEIQQERIQQSSDYSNALQATQRTNRHFSQLEGGPGGEPPGEDRHQAPHHHYRQLHSLLDSRAESLAMLDTQYAEINKLLQHELSLKTEAEDLGHMRSSAWEGARWQSHEEHRLRQSCYDLVLMLALMRKS